MDISPENYYGESDLVRDTLWAYDHLTNKNAAAEDAPSLGAWSLLLWAREYRNRFFEQVLPKAMAAKKKVEVDEQETQEDPGIEKAEKILADHELQWKREAVANTNETIKRAVETSVEEWERRFQLDLTPDAREIIYLGTVKLVDRVVGALSVTA